MSNVYWPGQMIQALKLGSMHRTHRVSVSYNPNARMAAAVLLQHGFISSVALGTAQGPDPSGFRALAGSPRAQMLWLDLKFRDHRPVIGDARTVSKPGLKLYFSPGEMKALLNGSTTRTVPPFERGEVGIVRTGEAVMSMGEAIMRNVGGEIIMRVSSE